MIRDIFCYHSAGSDKGIAANACATDDGAVSAKSGAFLDQSRLNLIHLADFSARIINVSKNHRRTAEDAVLQSHTFINRNIILYLAALADGYIWAYYHVLTDVAIFPYVGAGKDV
jgi:hypothetical protein